MSGIMFIFGIDGSFYSYFIPHTEDVFINAIAIIVVQGGIMFIFGIDGSFYSYFIPHTEDVFINAIAIIVVQGGVTPVASVLPSATAVKIKVNGQLEIFFIVNSQATISL